MDSLGDSMDFAVKVLGGSCDIALREALINEHSLANSNMARDQSADFLSE